MIDECDSVALSRTDSAPSVNCLTLKYLKSVGARSPRVLPQVNAIVSLSAERLWLRITALTADSTKWVVFNSDGALIGYALLSHTQWPVAFGTDEW